MNYDSLKMFLLNFYTRYLASWALKALAGFLAAHGVAAEQSGGQAQAIIEGLLAIIVFAADFWHSHATNQAALNTLPPNAVIHSVTIDANNGMTVTTASLITPTPIAK